MVMESAKEKEKSAIALSSMELAQQDVKGFVDASTNTDANADTGIDTGSSIALSSMELAQQEVKGFVDASTNTDANADTGIDSGSSIALSSMELAQQEVKGFVDASTNTGCKSARKELVIKIPETALQKVDELGQNEHVYVNVNEVCNRKRNRCSVCRHVCSYICASCYHFKNEVKFVCQKRKANFENSELNEKIKRVVNWHSCNLTHINQPKAL